MSHRVHAFVDGENLVTRYQEMVKAGAKPKPDTNHVKDVVVWHESITRKTIAEFTRVYFYQVVTGDAPAVAAAKTSVATIEFNYVSGPFSGNGRLVPKIFQKQARAKKSKSVDINLTVDMLRTSLNPNCDVVLLMSGDGDYVPLIEEVMRHGKQVWIGALSSGLNPDLKYLADDFWDLDGNLFQ